MSTMLPPDVIAKESITNKCFPPQAEYTQVLAKRVAEAKAQKADARKRRASSMRK